MNYWNSSKWLEQENEMLGDVADQLRSRIMELEDKVHDLEYENSDLDKENWDLRAQLEATEQ